MFSTSTDHKFQFSFTRTHTQQVLKSFTLLLLPLFVILLMGCTTFASTAVVLTTAGNQPLENTPAIVSNDTVSDVSAPALDHEPGRDVVVTTTFWVHSFQ
jgi:hypothetical protein